MYDKIAEPILAEVVRPVAEHILEQQEQADLPHYNDRFDSGRQAVKQWEQTKSRTPDDLLDVVVPVPGLDRGTPGSVLAPEVVAPTEVIQEAPAPAEQAKTLQEQLRVDAGLPPDFSADEAVNREALEAILQQWREGRHG